MPRGVLRTANLPQLQNLIKRDAAAYKEEFLQQWNHYNSIRQIFQINPDEQAAHFRELVTFISQVAQCYPKETAEFPTQLSTLLLEHYGSLSPDIRHSIVQNLVMLKNKGVITSIELLKTLFPLLPRTTSSTLRTFIRKTILSDIKTANMRSKNHKLNRAVQAMLFGMVERGMDGTVTGDKGKSRSQPAGSAEGQANSGDEAMWAVVLTKELWKKGIWDDAKPVSIVALGCFHPSAKVQSASLHFFLGSDEEVEDSDDEEDNAPDIRSLEHKREVTKKTRSGDKKLRRTMKEASKKRKRKDAGSLANFPALQLLNDPQTFGEKLYDMLNKYDNRFSLDHKILIMQLLARVTSAHKLTVLGFYTYVLKYISYHQLRVPAILASLAQSVHDFTPPDALIPVIRKLAQEFIHPGVGAEVVSAGLNSIREICRRQPWAMEEDLLGDLVEYRKSRDKAVTAAARGLLQLFREVNPGMLKRRERGKTASMGMAQGNQPAPFGHSAQAAVDIDGLVLLEDHLNALREEAGEASGEDEDDEEAWNGWDVESDSSDSSSDGEGWIDVDSDGDDHVSISDSEDEDEKGKKAKVGENNPGEEIPDPNRTSTLATTKILTPADFAKLNDLKIQAATKAVESGGGSAAKRKLASLEAAKKAASSGNDDSNLFISEMDILGPRKKAKADYEERMASIAKGREGREKFGSMKGKRNKEQPSSTTNREKARNKPIMMIMGSKGVKGKKKQSLREKQQRLRAHIDKAKKAYH
ncbi:protein required for actin cytoskeleton organization and cell cycle progression [Artomyces pyxidatus]|uniref:Protein required for actin cytoskeleton organization and cell cycle progression n=1 Tax=Artomyces pyxidatus TaxID=48021 RepID=A0ACB8SSM4_9AGAM|nr:protein required for actin cytoskeleton organization and cell cycle progression [Artomyces pyxidatus]